MSPRVNVGRLRSASSMVLPSVLSCDFSNLEREVRAVEAAGAQALHLDIMDGCFVPNLSFGLPVVRAFRRLTDLPLDVHLMIMHPEKYVERFRDAGADLITFHVEAVEQPVQLLRQIRELDCGAGIALNPATPLSDLDGCLGECDLILQMSVPAGFGGQKFDPIALEKLRRLRELVSEDVMLEVDGGVNQETIASCAEAGARYFVVGTAIFDQNDYGPIVQELQQLTCSL